MKLTDEVRRSGGFWRRDFLKFPLAAGLAGAFSAGKAFPAPRKEESDDNNAKIAVGVSPDVPDDELLFLRQMGIRWVHAMLGPAASYDEIKAFQGRLKPYGMRIHCGVMHVYRSLKIQLGQPGRDEDIEKFQTYLRDLGRLGIPVANIDFHPGNTYTTSEIEAERGYKVREFSIEDFRNKVEKPMYNREYSAKDIWEYYTYFIKAVMPVAEKADVRLALHPDDPPVAMMNGVAKLFVNYDGVKQADDIVGGSKYWGLTFCTGTWLEGGKQMGKDVFGMIKEFGGRNKIFTVHFRNVSSPLPRFHEVFQDEGYEDMYKVMKALREAHFTGSMIPDHYPGLVGDANRRIANAYMISYMRALLERANEELG